jgi:hypothetical protein
VLDSDAGPDEPGDAPKVRSGPVVEAPPAKAQDAGRCLVDSLATASRPAAWALAAAARTSPPATQPTSATPRFRAAPTSGASARCCAASSADPSAQASTRALTGVRASMSSEAVSSHSWSDDSSAGVKPSRRRARSTSSGPHGHRIGIQDEGSTRTHHVTPVWPRARV